MNEKVVKLAEELMAKSEVITLASINEEGFPRICAMANVRPEGIKTIWMATGTNSKKTVHFKNNPKASVCCHAGCDSLTLLGNVSVISDQGRQAFPMAGLVYRSLPQGKGRSRILRPQVRDKRGHYLRRGDIRDSLHIDKSPRLGFIGGLLYISCTR